MRLTFTMLDYYAVLKGARMELERRMEAQGHLHTYICHAQNKPGPSTHNMNPHTLGGCALINSMEL